MSGLRDVSEIFMRRGEVWWVIFNNSAGEEINKTRPAIIISNDISNKVLERVQIVPLTSNVSKCYSSEAIICLDHQKSKALAHQITTVSKKRLKSKIGVISNNDRKLVEQAIKIQLSLQL
jgi:mRNA interferase MazF